MTKSFSKSDVKRTKTIKIRVTEDEFLVLFNKADSKPLASFMREFCLTAKIPKRRIAPKIDPEFMRKFAGVCNNINQLTKEVHIDRQIMKTSLYAELKLLREKIEELKNDVSKLQ